MAFSPTLIASNRLKGILSPVVDWLCGAESKEQMYGLLSCVVGSRWLDVSLETCQAAVSCGKTPAILNWAATQQFLIGHEDYELYLMMTSP